MSCDSIPSRFSGSLPPPLPGRRHGRHMVVAVSIPANFRPTDLAEIPSDLLDAEVLGTHLSLADAVEVCREFNRKQVHDKFSDRLWGVLVYSPLGQKILISECNEIFFADDQRVDRQGALGLLYRGEAECDPTVLDAVLLAAEVVGQRGKTKRESNDEK